MNEQQKYFQKLCGITHPSNLKVTVVNYNSEMDRYIPGKRYNADKYQLHDERNVAVNEVVFDFDWGSYKANYEKAKSVIEVLDNRGIPNLICATGGKGIHVHIFFNKINFKTEEGKNAFKNALKYHFSFKHIRLWLWNTILDEAGIEEKFRTKQVDPKVIKFNYYQGTTHLIRDIGGRKYGKNSDGVWIAHYKTIITPEEFNSKKKIITRIDDVTYPQHIEHFDIDENELISYLHNFVNIQKKENIEELTNERIKGKYVELDGILKVREGLSEGNRNAGASILAIASRIDNLPKKEAYEIMKEYVDNCSQTGSPFSVDEANQWIDWIYNHEKPYWNCQGLEDLGVHERELCEHCQMRNREALELLTKPTILDQIREVLDMEVVGELNIKMLMFLLILSKDFPSPTGRPNWNIYNDPMSQNIIISSDSGSGKSWITKGILKLFGEQEQDYYVVSRMTKNAINYYTDINMDGKVIFIEELQGLDENTSQLRVWMSEGQISLLTVEKIKNAEGIEVNSQSHKTTMGQPVFITNQAEGAIEDQLNNRSWVLGMDLSKTQTSSILSLQDRANRLNHIVDTLKIRRIKDALKQLKIYHFVIPFADHEAMNIPIADIRARRDYQKFLTLIKCSAYLHQFQREKIKDDNGNEFLVCSIKDYEIAKRYSKGILGAVFSGLTTSHMDLINNIKNTTWKHEFMISDLMRNFGKTQPHWYGVLNQLADLGFISSQKSAGNSTIYSIVEHKTINIINMPSGYDLLRKIKDDGGITYKFIQDEMEISKGLSISEASLQNSELIGGFVNWGVRAYKQDFDKKSAISNFNIQNYGKFSTPSSFFIPKIGSEVIGGKGRSKLIEFMKKSSKHELEFHELAQEDITDKHLEKMLNQLKSEGIIFEPRPGRYMLL